MKQLKLEVGKTYLSREGREVTIVGNNDRVEYPCTGNNGQWYTESGRFHYDVPESPHDLIEEAPKFSRTFDIPNDVKKVTVEQVGNRIVVEMVPEAKEPKPGDVMVNDWGNVYIFKSDRHNGGYHNCFAWFGESGKLLIGDWCLPGRPATQKEAQPLFDALRKAGKRWNAEAMKVEDVPEIERIREWLRANFDYHLYAQGDVVEAIEAYLKYREGKK